MSSSQDKQLPATERKLQKARSDGQAARSRDLSHLAILGVGALGLLALAPWFVEYLQRALRQQALARPLVLRPISNSHVSISGRMVRSAF